MKHTLVGHTGFVGTNLAAAHAFDGLYNSRNIADSFGRDNGLVVYSGMPSEKFVAAADPAADLAVARTAFENICAMRPQRLVLISTVDVYPHPVGVDEETPAGGDDAAAYGANRLQLEAWVREAYPSALIVRLPALFGEGLKKNFVYDMMTITPGALTEEKYRALSAGSALVAESYAPGKGGFYRLVQMDAAKTAALKALFAAGNFNALCFTDSRSVFQFYNLARLWGHIERALGANLTLLNLATEPLCAAEVYRHIFGRPFCNELAKPPFRYDMRTRHAGVLGGQGQYLAGRDEVLADIAAFVAAHTQPGG